jgi:hypothetical protein
MAQCKASTVSNHRCKNSVHTHDDYCSVHLKKKRHDSFSSGVIGAVTGGLITSSPIGMLIAAATTVLATAKSTPTWKKKRVFVSFDYDQDRALKHALVAQSRLAGSPFEVIDASLKEAAPDHRWENRAKKLISGSDLVVVLLGRHTHRATGVLKEVAMARELKVPIMQLVGYQEFTCKPIRGAGRSYQWKWQYLEKLFATLPRT